MFNRSAQYSYRTQKEQRYKLLNILAFFLVLFILYNILTAFFFSVWVIDNDTMLPGLAKGDRVLFTSIKLKSVTNKNSDDYKYFFDRGSIVLVDKNLIQNQKWPFRAIDAIVKFFTAQRISIFSGESQYYIKRVIALPGDEISMTNFVFRVKTSSSQYSFTEFELSEKPYHPLIPQIPALWDESIPFSGNIEAIILGTDECYVISDDRSNTNDSRTWGALPPSIITARAVLRFWPINKIQLL